MLTLLSKRYCYCFMHQTHGWEWLELLLSEEQGALHRTNPSAAVSLNSTVPAYKVSPQREEADGILTGVARQS